MKVARMFAYAGIAAALFQQAAVAQAPPYRFQMVGAEDTTIRFGFLAQPQVESLEQAGDGGTDTTVSFRRLRLMAGGDLTERLSFFVESDSPNLGKELADGTHAADIFLQDAYVAYRFRPEFMLTGGMILVPLSRNSGQSAATLLPVDYGPCAFASSGITRSKVGRDYGVLARGYVRDHLEYRAGLFRGNRNHDGDFPYRYLFRVVYYPFEADTGYFYGGPSLGKKRILGIGASIDRQGTYSANSVDVFLDQPLAGGDSVTVRADWIRYDQQTPFLDQQTLLPTQNDWLLEGNYYFRRAKLAPFIQFSNRDLTGPGAPDSRKIQGGVAWYPSGNRVNLKAGLGRLIETGQDDRTQFVVQGQFFFY